MGRDVLIFMTWKTLGAERTLTEDDGTRLLDMLPVFAHRVNCHLLEIAVVTNHVHVIASVPDTTPLSQLAQRMKGASSRYLNLIERKRKLRWAHGYDSRSVGRDALPRVRAYFDGQDRKHHMPWVKRWSYGMQVPITKEDVLITDDDEQRLAG